MIVTSRFGVRRVGLGALVVLGACLACGGEEGGGGAKAPAPAASTPAAPAPGPAPAAAGAEAEQIFATRCVTCHGPNGAGDGPASVGLSPPPRNFQDPAWQAEVSDEHLANIIQYGGAAVGRSPTMPGNPDLTAKPEVVKALVAHLRSLEAR